MPSSGYELVPKGLRENLAFRRKLVLAGSNSEDDATSLWTMCARDILFYVNTFVFTYDPRLVGKNQTPAVPFITYPFQDTTLLEINDAIECQEDIGVEKSRDMGASWMFLLVYEWRFHFKDHQRFLCVSRKEELVDKTGDPKALFWKIDFIHLGQPNWLLPAMTRNNLHIGNDDNGSVIDGESTTGDVARGDRCTSIMLDEFASVEDGGHVLRATRDASGCRGFNSTAKGQGNAFFQQLDKMKQTGGRVITLHWPLHPVKAEGLWIDEDSRHKGRGENKGERSPWFDGECKRAAHDMEIAQELSIDYLGSDYVFFDLADLSRIKREWCTEPVLRTELDYDVERCEAEGLAHTADGRLHLWIPISPDGRPPQDEYVVACDIATGTGASQSVISIGSKRLRKKIGVFRSNMIRPEELARLAVAIARFFGDALLIWEANGPGRNFGDVVVEVGYSNIFFRVNELSISKKQSDIPGWHSTKDTKRALLGNYRRALAKDQFINPSLPGINECASYIFTQAGSVEHSRALNAEDPSAAKDNHGDECIADALCCKGLRLSDITEKVEDDIPEGSMMARRLAHRRERAADTADLW